MMSHPLNHSPQQTDHSRQLTHWQSAFESHLTDLLSDRESSPGKLQEAMRYSALDGGKRMRPLLVFAAGQALNIEAERLHGIAAAIELIHSYSLIHDDLPAMDDDDLRRGRPTSHRQFDEATAILAGDALQALAFEVLARDASLQSNPEAQVRIIGDIAHACGCAGMAGGQVLDLAAINQTVTVDDLETMHRLKTGALIKVSATAPALLARAEPELVARLARFGGKVGLAFQIHDDVLDVTASSADTGKPTHADAARNKPAFPALIGIDGSKQRSAQLCADAIAQLHGFPGDTRILQWLAEYAIQRGS